jgi:predicted glycosyltransferase
MMSDESVIWFDIEIPKSVLFFEPIIREIQKHKKVLITTRGGKGYDETVKLFELYGLEYESIGEFGGSCLVSKYKASLERQVKILDYLAQHNIEKLVCLSSVDGCRAAFGLGIPIYNFYDIPLSDYNEDFTKALPQARLTIPIATKMFKPFVVPDSIIERFGLDQSQIVEYDFIDPLIWLKNFTYDESYVKEILAKYDIDYNKKIIIIREEEYKASYVDKKYPFLYETLEKIHKELDVNIIIIPRYESDYLKEEFPFAIVLEEKVKVQHLLKFADLFIGGGGTLNTEACFLGTPTISTRSFICHYDKWQIDNGLMKWVTDKEGLFEATQNMISQRIDKKSEDVIKKMNLNLDSLITSILE